MNISTKTRAKLLNNMLYINSVIKLKYAQCIRRSGPMHHFPHHCHERTSGMSEHDSTRKSNAKEESRLRKNAKSRQRYLENKERILSYHANLYQSKKLSDPEFMKERAKKSAALRKKNPEITRLSNAKRRIKNPEAERARCREWFAKNPDKRAIYQHNRQAKITESGRLSSDLASKLYKLQKGKCACCSSPLGDDYHLDHIMPLALGGLNVDGNMQLLTATCNMQKNTKHPIDFMRSKGFLL